jgi:membrane protease YdiL (CAAX protease family)
MRLDVIPGEDSCGHAGRREDHVDAKIEPDAAANVLGKFMKFSVSPLECYFYYIAIAIAEESFYRIFLVYLQLIIASLFTNDLRAMKVIATVDSSIIFAVAHWWVYGDPASLLYFPPMLYAAFVLGLVFAGVMIHTKNPLVNVGAHMFVNAIARISLVLG